MAAVTNDFKWSGLKQYKLMNLQSLGSDVRHRPPWAKIKCWQGSLLLEVLEKRPSPGLFPLQSRWHSLAPGPFLQPQSSNIGSLCRPSMVTFPPTLFCLSSNFKDPLCLHWAPLRIQDCLPRLHQLMRDLGSICKHSSPLPFEVLEIGYRFFSLGSCYPSNYTA